LLRRERFATREAARMRIFWYIECFYNTRSRHSGLGYLSPADYETRYQQETMCGLATRCQPDRVKSTGSL
jgi:putative transposase